MWSARSMPAAALRSSAIPNYWGRDLAINRGLWNFDEIRFDFYRDANSHLEAFKKGLYDVRIETDPGRWETAYDVPAVRDGRIVKETFPNGLPKIFSGLVFNTRRPIFSDIRVREAIGMLFDFEWVNHNYFYDRYERSASYFEGSELSARGRPADARERALLAPFPDAVRADVMDGTWQPAVTDGSGRDREHAQARARAARRRRLRARRHGAALACDAKAARLRNPGHHPGSGAAGARLLARPQARRHRRPRARGRRRAVRPAATHLRFRHDRIPLGPIALARQRAGLLLGLRRGRLPTARATTWASKAPPSTP